MDSKEKLLNTLEEVYGPRNLNTSRFGSTSLGKIADDLCLSNSLLTKLISGTATQGMYERCQNNLSRIKQTKTLMSLNHELQSKLDTKPEKFPWKVMLPVVTVLLALIAYQYSIINHISNNTNDLDNNVATTFLNRFFNPDFDKPSLLPYVTSDKVQDFCPCSGFEGDWELAKPYTIPIPFNKPGLYYVAKSSEIKLKCVSSELDELKGKKMHGFEIMKHELWMDSEHEPLVPNYFNSEKKQYTKQFYNLDFDNNQRFERVSEFTTFFYNSFQITDRSISRKGEPSGRYASYINEEAIARYKIDLNEILNHVVGNMTNVSCYEMSNLYCNPNSLVEGESTIGFDCEFSIETENLGYGGTYPYTKTYRLINQHYSNNLLCSCTDEVSDLHMR